MWQGRGAVACTHSLSWLRCWQALMHSCNRHRRLSFLSAGKKRSDIFSVQRMRAHIQPVSVATFVKLLHFMDRRLSSLRHKTGVERRCPCPDCFTNTKLSSDDSWWALCSICYACQRDCLPAYNSGLMWLANSKQTINVCIWYQNLVPCLHTLHSSEHSYVLVLTHLTSYFFTWKESFSLWKACWGKSKIDVNGTISSWTLHWGHFDKLLALALSDKTTHTATKHTNARCLLLPVKRPSYHL